MYRSLNFSCDASTKQVLSPKMRKELYVVPSCRPNSMSNLSRSQSRERMLIVSSATSTTLQRHKRLCEYMVYLLHNCILAATPAEVTEAEYS